MLDRPRCRHPHRGAGRRRGGQINRWARCDRWRGVDARWRLFNAGRHRPDRRLSRRQSNRASDWRVEIGELGPESLQVLRYPLVVFVTSLSARPTPATSPALPIPPATRPASPAASAASGCFPPASATLPPAPASPSPGIKSINRSPAFSSAPKPGRAVLQSSRCSSALLMLVRNKGIERIYQTITTRHPGKHHLA